MGWDSESESDEEPLNISLFVRKSFGFLGLPEEKVNTLKKIVKGLGGTCDGLPKYIFTTSKHFDSLSDNNTSLYNVTYIRDCIDANRCLSIDQYKFGQKFEKKDYRDFDPCCQIFHNDKDACAICDSALNIEVLAVNENTKVKHKRNKTIEVENDIPTKKEKISISYTEQDCQNSFKLRKRHKGKAGCWEPWECRVILDYIICNNLFLYCKSPSLYKRIAKEGYLKHRSAESMRVQFRKHILTSIESYNLPKPILKKFKQVQNIKGRIRKSFNKNEMNGKQEIQSEIS